MPITAPKWWGNTDGLCLRCKMPKEMGWKNSRARDSVQSEPTITSQSLMAEKFLFFNSKFKVQGKKYWEVPTFDFHLIPHIACLPHISWNKNWVMQLPYSKSSCKSYDLYIPVCFKPFLFQIAPLRRYWPYYHYYFLLTAWDIVTYHWLSVFPPQTCARCASSFHFPRTLLKHHLLTKPLAGHPFWNSTSSHSLSFIVLSPSSSYHLPGPRFTLFLCLCVYCLSFHISSVMLGIYFIHWSIPTA